MDFEDKVPLNNTDLFLYDDSASKLGTLAAKIAYYNFEWRFITLVIYHTMQAIGLNTFLVNYEQTVFMKLGRYIPSHRVSVPQFVIFGEDTEILRTLRWIARNDYELNGKFIIICASHTQECDEQKLFKQLQQLHVINVIVLKTSNETAEPLAYSYQIITPENCLNNVPHLVNLFIGCSGDKCLKNLFPEKLLNLYGCRMFMSTVEQAPFMHLDNTSKAPSGIDGDIMKIAADMLNATLVARTPADGTDSGHYTYNNWTGSLGDIFNARAHISVCATPLSSYMYGNFQISFTYYSMDIVWATRLPSQKPSSAKILYPLNLHLRIILFFMFIAIVFINIFCTTNIFHKARKACYIESPKCSLLFYSWLIFLGIPILKTSRRSSFTITIFTWIWFCFIIRSAYQAALINSLKQPAYDDDVQSFRDVVVKGYPYGGEALLKEYYYDDGDIYDKWIVVDFDHVYDALDDILEGATDFVIASNKEIIIHHLMKYKGKKKLKIIPEKIVNSPMVVYLKKFSPLTFALNYVLRVALEGGFIRRIFERYLDHDRTLLRTFESHELVPLSMEHFGGSFVILILGWLLSITYFAVEFICGNLDDE